MVLQRTDGIPAPVKFSNGMATAALNGGGIAKEEVTCAAP